MLPGTLGHLGMTIARVGRLTLAPDQGEPRGVLCEVGFRVQPVPAVADGDGDRPAHAIVPFPVCQVTGARRRGAETVPQLALECEARSLPIIPASRHHL